MLKKFIKKLFNSLGYKIIKINSFDGPDLDYISKFLIKDKNPVIIDVGANRGESISRYKTIFQEPTIHSFEPNLSEYKKLKEKYIFDKKVILNNKALSDKEQFKEFNINSISGHSSFKKIVPNTKWLKKRSNSININSDKYTKEKVSINTITLDDYITSKKIKKIDVLKIDTQGYEDKVLSGAKNLIKENKIRLIQLEVIFSEIYENPLQIYDIEKILVPNNYKLVGISSGGSLITNYIFELDFIYISNSDYEKFINS